MTGDAEMFSQSRTMDFHNKADGHERRIATYLIENFRLSSNLEVGQYPFKHQSGRKGLTIFKDVCISQPTCAKRGNGLCVPWLAT